MCQTLQEYDENQKVRKGAIQAKWKILQAVILPSFFLNVENWTNSSKKEMEKMEQLYKKLIYQVFGLSRTAPYRGFDPADAPSLDIFTRKLRDDNALICSFFLIFIFYLCYVLFRPHIHATNAVHLSSDF